jgi:hypothetical protein
LGPIPNGRLTIIGGYYGETSSSGYQCRPEGTAPVTLTGPDPQTSFARYNFDVCGISRHPLHPVAPSHPRRVKTCFDARKRLLSPCMPILSLCAPLGSPCTRSARVRHICTLPATPLPAFYLLSCLPLNTAPPLPRAAPSLPSTLCSQSRRPVANNCFRYKGTTFFGSLLAQSIDE